MDNKGRNERSQQGAHGARISALEQNMEALHQDLNGLRTDVRTALEKLYQRLDDNSKPQYSTWISFVGLVLVIISGQYFLVSRPIETSISEAKSHRTSISDKVGSLATSFAANEEQDRERHASLSDEQRDSREERHELESQIERLAAVMNQSIGRDSERERRLASIESIAAALKQDVKDMNGHMHGALGEFNRELGVIRERVSLKGTP